MPLWAHRRPPRLPHLSRAVYNSSLSDVYSYSTLSSAAGGFFYCLGFSGTYLPDLLLLAAWESEEEKPTSPSSELDWLLLSVMLSVCMSHSLSSGMLPGLVRIVRTIEKPSKNAKKVKTNECTRVRCCEESSQGLGKP